MSTVSQSHISSQRIPTQAMSIMLTTYLVLLALSCYVLATARRRLSRRTPTADVMSAIRAVLEPPSTSLQALLTSRAGSNERLRLSFRLTNTFVSDDPDVHRSFVTQARALIHSESTPRARRTFAELCSSVVHEYLHNNAKPRAAFDDVVQVVTFKIILSSLFHTDLGLLTDDDEILFAARAINTLWQLSKQRTPPPPDLLPTLNTLLRGWLPAYDNPLDFIVPTYETMWRVVASAVALVHRHGGPALRASFTTFLENPDRTHYQIWPSASSSSSSADADADADATASIEAVVLETMRHFPPTRRISRRASVPSPFFSSLFTSASAADVTVVADIASAHHSPTVWGPTHTAFDPSRFHPARLTEEQKQCMLAFGYGPLKCVAKDWAPHTAALVVAALLSATCRTGGEGRASDPGFNIVEGERIGSREGWEGWEVVKV